MQSVTGKSNLFERGSRNIMTYVRIVRIVHASVVCAVGIIAALCAGSCLRCVRAQWVSLHLVRVRDLLIQPCILLTCYGNIVEHAQQQCKYRHDTQLGRCSAMVRTDMTSYKDG